MLLFTKKPENKAIEEGFGKMTLESALKWMHEPEGWVRMVWVRWWRKGDQEGEKAFGKGKMNYESVRYLNNAKKFSEAKV
jgi:hypothetical protein